MAAAADTAIIAFFISSSFPESAPLFSSSRRARGAGEGRTLIGRNMFGGSAAGYALPEPLVLRRTRGA